MMEIEPRPPIFGRFDVYLAIVLFVLVAMLGGIIVIVVWPARAWIAWSAIGLLGIFIGLRIFMMLHHHFVDIEAKKNRAKVIHDSENGFGYIHENKINGYSHQAPLMLPAPDTLPEPASFPATFKEMAIEGYVGPDHDFVLGFDENTGDPVRLPTLTSLGIGGGQGSGKTVSTLVIMMEAIAKYNGKIRLIVIDPHMFVAGEEPLMAKAGPLLPFFLTVDDVRTTVEEDDHQYLALLSRLSNLPNPSIGGEELWGWMEVIQMEMDRRLAGKVGYTWMIIIDEFGEVAGDGRVTRMLEHINNHGRKMNMFALLISQEWKATRTGGSEIRHSIVSWLLHNMPASIAELIVPPDIARLTLTRNVGQAIFHSRGMGRAVRMPYASEQDAEWLVRRYDPKPIQIREVRDTTIPITATYTELPGRETLSFYAASPTETLLPVSSSLELPVGFVKVELEEISKLFADGVTESDIARQVYHAESRREVEKAKVRVHEQLVWVLMNGRNK